MQGRAAPVARRTECTAVMEVRRAPGSGLGGWRGGTSDRRRDGDHSVAGGTVDAFDERDPHGGQHPAHALADVVDGDCVYTVVPERGDAGVVRPVGSGVAAGIPADS